MGRKRTLLLTVAISVAGFAAAARAADVPEAVLKQFQVSAAPPGITQDVLPTPASAPTVEHTATLDGTHYAVIAPIYTGSDGNISFIRLSNQLFASGASLATGADIAKAGFTINVVGVPSGVVYGTATYSISQQSSPQYSINDILTKAGVTGLASGDTGYALYIAQNDVLAKYEAYQHVIYSSQSTFFENASLCNVFRNGAGASQQVVSNVHTSALTGYPSQIFIHNYQNAAVTYQVYVMDANSGYQLGQVNLTTSANASYLIPESFVEQQINFSPTQNQQHINLFVFNRPAPTVFNPVNAVVGHYIYNQPLAAYVNMSVACAVTGG